MNQLIYPVVVMVIGIAFSPSSQSRTEPILHDPERVISASPYLVTVPSPAGKGAMAPRLTESNPGLILSWLSPVPDLKTSLQGSASRLRWSSWNGMAWSEPVTVAASSHMFTNSADIPSVIASSKHGYFASWLEKSGDSEYGYDVQLAHSSDGGIEWHAMGPLWHASRPGRQTYDGFASWVREGKRMHVFWIDGRLYSDDAGGPMRLMTALVGQKVHKEMVLDENICSCCDTTAVITNDGPVAFYRGRTADEIRDIMVVRKTHAGWTSPEPIAEDNWQIAGCPVNGPSSAARGNRVAVAWFTGATGKGRVRTVFSEDAGRTFGTPIDIDRISPKGPIGRVDIALLRHGEAIVSWLGRGSKGNKAILYLRRVTADGSVSPYLKIAELDEERSIGFPQLGIEGNTLLLAWTIPSKNAKGGSPHDKAQGIDLTGLDTRQVPAVITR